MKPEVKSVLEGKSAEEIAGALKELPADQLAMIKQACYAAGPLAVTSLAHQFM